MGMRWITWAGLMASTAIAVAATHAGLHELDDPVAPKPPIDPAAVAASKDFAARYDALRREGLPQNAANANKLIEKAARLIRDASQKAMGEANPKAHHSKIVLSEVDDPNASEEQQRLARIGVNAAIAAGVTRMTAEIATKPLAWDVTVNSGLVATTQYPAIGSARAIARFQRGRMAVARETGQRADWTTSFEETMTLGRQTSREPGYMAYMVGYAIQSVALESARRLVISGTADEPTLARAAHIIDTIRVMPMEHAIRGEQVMVEDAIDLVYRGGIRFLDTRGQDMPLPVPRGELSTPDTRGLGPGLPPRPEHITLIAREYQTLAQLADLTVAQRAEARAKAPPPAERTSLIFDMMKLADRAYMSWDQYRSDLVGTRTIIAIERYRLAHGKLPDSLSDLVPTFLPTLPLDPTSGTQLGYLPPPKGPYASGRPYLLYAAGADGKDDGGKVDFESPFRAFRTSAESGTDFLLNRETPSGRVKAP